MQSHDFKMDMKIQKFLPTKVSIIIKSEVRTRINGLRLRIGQVRDVLKGMIRMITKRDLL